MNGLLLRLLRPPPEPLERSVTMLTISVARPAAAARLSGSEHAVALAPSAAATVTFRSLHKPSHSKITISGWPLMNLHDDDNHGWKEEGTETDLKSRKKP